MKTLLVCYSLSGKTKQLCLVMKRTLGGDLTTLSETKNRSVIGAYIMGSLEARMRRASLTQPLESDIAEYKQIILAGPVWAGYPAPALNDFLRQHDLEGKRIYGFLTHGGKDAPIAKKILEEEITASKARLKNILTVSTNRETVRALKGGRLCFDLDDEGNLCIVKGEPNADE